PLALASLLGVGWALWRRRAADVLLLSLAVPYFLTVGSSQSHSARYLIPLFPLLMILAARALYELCVIPRAAGQSARWPRPLPALAFAVAILMAFGQSAAQARELLLPDTRRAAREWIEREVPPDTAIALEWGGDDTVRLAESRESLEEKIRGYQEGTKQSDHQAPEQMVAALRLLQKAQTGRPGFRLVKLGRMQDNRLEGQGQDLDALRNLGVSYVVQSSAALGDARSEAFARAYPEAAAFYTRLEREARLVARFAAEKGRLRGPEIAIYRLSTGAALASAAAAPEEARE
ncbi:MAG TPA: hypothetical protein VIZ31_05105, partial [Vicinamibacteria bacterium]